MAILIKRNAVLRNQSLAGRNRCIEQRDIQSAVGLTNIYKIRVQQIYRGLRKKKDKQTSRSRRRQFSIVGLAFNISKIDDCKCCILSPTTRHVTESPAFHSTFFILPSAQVEVCNVHLECILIDQW